MTKKYPVPFLGKIMTLCLGVFSVTVVAQQSYTFTNAGATGSLGPTQTDINTAYVSTNLNGSVTINPQGVQNFTVPSTGPYRIEAYGAQGYGTYGGRGAVMIGDFTLTAGTVLKVVVGQTALINNTSYNLQFGGGGGSYITYTNNTPLVVAGGGGGSHAGSFVSTADGTTSTSGNPATGGTSNGSGGTAGNGGTAGGSADGGGGLLTNGTGPSAPGLAYVNGATGGGLRGIGGFGGGAGTSSWNNARGGGGGGYSGGGGAENASGGAIGGGGGSFNSGANQNNTSGARLGDGLVIIRELCPIFISSSSSGTNAPSICAGQSITLTTSAVSNYSWSTGASTSSIVVSPSVNTVYSFTGTSSQSCTAGTSMSVTVSSGFPSLTVTTAQNPICLGAATSFSATGALSYTWTSGISNGQAFSPTVTTSYTLSGQNGCGISTTVRTITVAPLAVSTLASPTLVCQGYTSTLTAVSSVGGYTWNPGNITGNNAIVAPVANTIYTVSASDGTCTGTQTVLVTTKTTPTIVPSVTLTSICLGDVLTLSASGAGTGGTYSWSPGNGSGSTFTTSPAASTVFVVTGTNSLNCTSSAQVPVIVNQPDPLTVTASKTLVCSGAQVVLTATGSAGYSWSGGPSTPGYTINPTAPYTVYSVTGSSSSNSCTATRTIAIAAITPSVVYTSSVNICAGQAATLSASGASTYTWNAVNTGSSGVYVTTPAQTSTYVLLANTLSITTNCSSSYSAVVKVNPNPTVAIAATKTTTICKGVTVTLTASGAQTYTWNTGANSSSISVTPSVTTTYSVDGSDANNCGGSQLYVVNVSKCTGVNEDIISAGITVYPNPNKGVFTIHASVEAKLVLVNNIGQLIRSVSLNAEAGLEINVSDLSKGVYFLSGVADGIPVNVKIIVAE